MPKINATEDIKLSPKKAKTKLPSMYKVIILNDDFTPMEFVVNTIQRFFNKSVDEATRIMLDTYRGIRCMWNFPCRYCRNKNESSAKLCKRTSASFAMYY